MKNGLHIEMNGDKSWYHNDKLHREDGPAVILTNGSMFWCIDGNLHREDGPAIEHPDGIAEWYLNGAYLGSNAGGFWALWEKLTPEKQNNLNLHRWMVKFS